MQDHFAAKNASLKGKTHGQGNQQRESYLTGVRATHIGEFCSLGPTFFVQTWPYFRGIAGCYSVPTTSKLNQILSPDSLSLPGIRLGEWNRT